MNLSDITAGNGLSAIARRTRSGRRGTPRLGNAASARRLTESGLVIYQQACTLQPGQTLRLQTLAGTSTAPPGGAGMVITGTLADPDLTGTMKVAGTSQGKPYYTVGGVPSLEMKLDYIGPLLTWYSSISSWVLIEHGTGIHEGTASEGNYVSTSNVATPDLATGWTAGSGASGTPVVTADTVVTAPSLEFVSGQDFEGRTLPALSEIVAFEVVTGAGAILLQSNWEAFTIPAFSCPLPLESSLQFTSPTGKDLEQLFLLNQSLVASRVAITLVGRPD